MKHTTVFIHSSIFHYRNFSCSLTTSSRTLQWIFRYRSLSGFPKFSFVYRQVPELVNMFQITYSKYSFAMTKKITTLNYIKRKNPSPRN